MIDYKLLQDIIQHINATGKTQVLDRIRLLLAADDESDEERRIDLMFVYLHNDFPVSDDELLWMYMNWVDSAFGLQP